MDRITGQLMEGLQHIVQENWDEKGKDIPDNEAKGGLGRFFDSGWSLHGEKQDGVTELSHPTHGLLRITRKPGTYIPNSGKLAGGMTVPGGMLSWNNRATANSAGPKAVGATDKGLVAYMRSLHGEQW